MRSISTWEAWETIEKPWKKRGIKALFSTTPWLARNEISSST
jgi:hypothetical protein